MLQHQIGQAIEEFLLSAQETVSVEDLQRGGYVAYLMRPLSAGLYLTGDEDMERVYWSESFSESTTKTLGEVLQEAVRSIPPLARDTLLARYEAEEINLVLSCTLGIPECKLLMVNRDTGLSGAITVTTFTIPVVQSH